MTSYPSKSHRWKSGFSGEAEASWGGQPPASLSAAMNRLMQVLRDVPPFCPICLYWLSNFTNSLKSTPQQAFPWLEVPGS